MSPYAPQNDIESWKAPSVEIVSPKPKKRMRQLQDEVLETAQEETAQPLSKRQKTVTNKTEKKQEERKVAEVRKTTPKPKTVLQKPEALHPEKISEEKDEQEQERKEIIQPLPKRAKIAACKTHIEKEEKNKLIAPPTMPLIESKKPQNKVEDKSKDAQSSQVSKSSLSLLPRSVALRMQQSASTQQPITQQPVITQPVITQPIVTQKPEITQQPLQKNITPTPTRHITSNQFGKKIVFGDDGDGKLQIKV